MTDAVTPHCHEGLELRNPGVQLLHYHIWARLSNSVQKNQDKADTKIENKYGNNANPKPRMSCGLILNNQAPVDVKIVNSESD